MKKIIILVLNLFLIFSTLIANNKSDVVLNSELSEFEKSKNSCEGFTKVVTQNLTNSGVLNFSIKAGPKPITKVTLSLIYLKSVTDPNCPICKKADWGFLFCAGCPLGGFAGATDVHKREITWANSSGVDMFNTPRSGSTGLFLDPVSTGGVSNSLMRCCKTDIEYCIRYSFTDIDCVTCDIVICSKKTIGGSLTPIPSDTLQRQYKLMQEQLRNQNDLPNIKEKENNGEGQGSMGYKLSSYTNNADSIEFDEETYRQILREENLNEDEINNQIDDIRKKIVQMKQETYFQISEPGSEIQERSVNQLCTNGGFELGNFSSWEGSYGSSSTNNFAPVPPGLPGLNMVFPNSGFLPPTYTGPVGSNTYWGQHDLMPDLAWAPSGVDPILISSTPVVNMPVIPPSGGTHSLRLGNPWMAHGAERISQTFLVSSSNFSFRYAAVLQKSHSNPNGNMNGSESYFVAKILDMNGNELFRLNQVGFPNNIFTQSTVCNSFRGLTWGNVSNPNTLYYVDWTCINVQLNSSYIGQNITVEFTTSDCSGGAHFAYAYIDEICGTVCSGGNNYGFNGINTITGQCSPLRICGTFDPPIANGVTGTLSSISLTLYRNGIPVTTYGPFTPTINASTKTYCFDLIQSQFPGLTALNDGFDVVTTANFTIGSNSHSVASGSPITGYVSGQNNDIKVLCKTDCCIDFKKKVTTNLSTNNTINVSFSAGPNNIKRIVAEIIDFSTSYNDQYSPNGTTNCATCSNNSDTWGNFYVPNSPPSVFGLSGKLTVPSNSTSKYGREIVWGSLDGSDVNMTSPSPQISIKLGLPVKSRSACCADTIKMCVRYKFTDIKCVTCDTVVCYKIVRRTGIGMIDEMNDEKNLTETKVTTLSSVGQSAGKMNIDIQKTSKSKVTIYNTNGEELMKLYNDNIIPGQYSFDLNSYSFPDGLYYCKLEYNGESEYDKIIMTKPLGNCNYYN